jgi:hypothetical protein
MPDDALVERLGDLTWLVILAEAGHLHDGGDDAATVNEASRALVLADLQSVEAEVTWRRTRGLHKPRYATLYPRDVLQAIKVRISLPNIAHNRGLELRQHGRRYVGPCPFHDDRTPSFTVFADDPADEHFYCFGCHVGGDVFEFVQAYDRLDFRHAVEGLAISAGVDLPACAIPAQRIGRYGRPGDGVRL